MTTAVVFSTSVCVCVCVHSDCCLAVKDETTGNQITLCSYVALVCCVLYFFSFFFFPLLLLSPDTVGIKERSQRPESVCIVTGVSR